MTLSLDLYWESFKGERYQHHAYTGQTGSHLLAFQAGEKGTQLFLMNGLIKEIQMMPLHKVCQLPSVSLRVLSSSKTIGEDQTMWIIHQT